MATAWRPAEAHRGDADDRGRQPDGRFRGSSPQARGPINATMATTRSAVYYAVIAASGIEATANSGCYRPITVSAPDGLLVSAQFPRRSRCAC